MLPVDIKSELTAEKLREILEYDPGLGTLRWKIRSSARVYPGDLAGCPIGDYIQITINTQRYMAHRLIWLHVIGEWPSCEIDHINGVKNDNRISNLREATVVQNRRNRLPKKNTKLGIKGVQRTRVGTFRAIIWFNGKNINLGSFKTKEAASERYQAAAKEYFGEFAHRSI